MEKKRVKWADACRGIGIVYVVIGHVFAMDIAYKWFVSFHMPLFVFLSGLFFSDSKKQAYVLSRIKSVVFPYYLFSIFSLIYYWGIEIHFRNMGISVKNSLLGCIFCYIPWMNNAPLWYLPCFFVILIFFYLLKKKLSMNQILLVGVVLNSMYWLLSFDDYLYKFPFEIPRVIDLFVYYSLGAKIKEWIQEIEKLQRKFSARIMYILGVNAVSIILAFGLLEFKPAILHIPLALIGINGTVALALVLKNSIFLENAGRKSLFILCTHVPIYRLLIGVISKITSKSSDFIKMKWYYALPIVFLTIIICLCFELVVQKSKKILVERLEHSVKKDGAGNG